MSSSPFSSDEAVGEGQGYADGGKEPTTFIGSSILGSAEASDREVEEANIVLEIDTAREWRYSASPPPVNGYDWALHEVGMYAPYYVTSTSLEYFASRVNIVSTAKDVDSILLTHIVSRPRCHLPFTEFQSSVLRDLNVAPTQLHPNGWGYMQAFVVVCTALALTPRSAAFLYFFRAIPQANKSWVSLTLVKGKQLFTPFNSSYKEFKTRFFKVSIKEEGLSSFYLDDGQPKFPFYWTEHPKKVVSRAKSSMTPEELEIVSLIDQLPRKTSSRALIGLSGSNSLCSRVFAPYSSPSSTPSTVQVEDEASLQGGEKRKVVKDKSVSSGKKKRRKVPEGPLLAGSFDSTVDLADRLEYRLNPEEKKLFHGMTIGEVVDLAYELNVRSNLCLAYAVGSAKSIIAEEFEAALLELEKAKKSNENLTRRVEEIQKMAEDE
ncbi:hypothetical protein LR48_Vigan11g110900 [Vigna angularis]|uniref:Transposase (putative) gypsy type domain-containing protein n=1 Tax=Phaseolus angularis TaxID=3914 RepID=A0A0L9VSN1_PHAAN|nr:hypothetical protein LR48_Vigan11g110900 [Vigna angularis]